MKFINKILIYIIFKEGQKLDFQFTDHVPLQDLFSAIDDHYNLRNDLRSVKERLEKKTIEFTTI